jgi:hypothetical protein
VVIRINLPALVNAFCLCLTKRQEQYPQLSSQHTDRTALLPQTKTHILPTAIAPIMALDSFFHNKIESMKLEIIQGQAVLRRLEAQRNDYNSRGNDGAYPSPSPPS